MARIPIVRADVRWLLLSTAHANYPRLRNLCRTRHEETVIRDNRASLFSEVLSDDGTLALVKIAGADINWRTLNGIDEGAGRDAAILDSYMQRDHDRAKTLLRTGTNWTNTRRVEGP